jgi:Flp pilus assembly protein TadB
MIAFVPVVFPILVERVSPGYFEPLRTHPLGWVAVAIAIGLWMSALVIGRRILAVTL